MNDELRIQALQAALDQANMMLIEQREVMQLALEALEACCGWPKVIEALREVLGGEE
jgi:methylmalonyl-CoA mutase N-terminal domain/subunit